MAVTGTPTSGDDTLTGDGADDSIVGQQGNDSIAGGGGDDVIRGDVELAINAGLDSNQPNNSWSAGTVSGWYNSGSGGTIERWGYGFQGLSPNDGTQFIELDGNTAGLDHVQTDIALETGITYVLSFDHAARLGPGVNDSFEVTHNGVVVATISPTSTSYFETTEITITGLAGTDTIGFRELASQDSGQGPLIDNISLSLTEAAAAADSYDYNDTLEGNAGNDSIYGQEGDDVITGGSGDDYLSGGVGDDTFVMSDGDGSDIVSDFVIGEDIFDVSGLNDAFGNPVDVKDAVVTSDGAGGSIVTFPNGEEFRLVGIDPTDLDTYSELNAIGIPCFVAGTQIATPRGDVSVEKLNAGDVVWTFKDGKILAKELVRVFRRSLGMADLLANPKLRPVKISKAALGYGLPKSDLYVSRQHRMVTQSKIVERMFGVPEVLVSAIKLTKLDGVEIDTTAKDVEYVHLLFDTHEIVLAEGAPSESLYTGKEALDAISPEARDEILTIFPELSTETHQPTPALPMPPLSRQKRLVDRHQKNSMAMLAETKRFERAV